jgi:hypothetical protein
VLVYLAAAGLLKLYASELDGAVAASVAALIGDRHWMYWLAAQSNAGRNAELGYLALAVLIEDAQISGATAVNLGASAGLPGRGRWARGRAHSWSRWFALENRAHSNSRTGLACAVPTFE